MFESINISNMWSILNQSFCTFKRKGKRIISPSSSSASPSSSSSPPPPSPPLHNHCSQENCSQDDEEHRVPHPNVLKQALIFCTPLNLSRSIDFVPVQLYLLITGGGGCPVIRLWASSLLAGPRILENSLYSLR